MRSSSRIAAFTCLAFAAAMMWPYVARAQQAQPQPAPADEALQQAKSHFEAGKNAYNAGDYVTAIREFKAAEALRPSPILDYNIGLANEKLGKRRVAVKYYRRYLEGMPNASNRAQVEANIAELEKQIAAQPAPTPQQPTPPQQVEQPSDMPPQQQPSTYSSYDPYGQTPPPGTPPPKPKKKSYWWVALIVVGGVLLIGGVIAYALVVSSSAYTYGASALTSPERSPPPSIDASQRTPSFGPALFTF